MMFLFICTCVKESVMSVFKQRKMRKSVGVKGTEWGCVSRSVFCSPFVPQEIVPVSFCIILCLSFFSC